MTAVRLFGFLVVFVTTQATLAVGELPQTFTLDGTLYATPTGTDPLLDNNVQVRLQILNPSKTCVLYEEVQALNTFSSKGYFNIQVGSAVGSTKRVSGSDPGLTMQQVYQNSGVITGTGSSCGGSYVPAAGDVRYLRITVSSSSGSTNVLSPDMIVNSIPTATVAESLQGYSPSNFLRLGHESLSQANAENVFSTSNYARLTSLLSTDPTNYMRSDSSSGANLPSLAAAPSSTPAEGAVWFNSTTNQMQFYDGTSVQTLGTTSGVLSESQIPTLTTPGKVSGNAINSGTIGGSTAINTSGNIATSGAISGASLAARSIDIYDSDNSNRVRLKTPATAVLTSDYDLTLPATAGANGQVLVATDGTGGLGWQTLSGVSPGGSASGDLSGSYPGPTVARIQGVAVSATGPSGAGQVLRYNGTSQYAAGYIGLADIHSSVNPLNPVFPASACASSETLAWSSLTDTMVCTPISLDVAALTGTLPINKGGTGQTTATAAFNALAPSQGSNSGKYLTTDGTNTSWAALPGAISSLNGSTQATQTFANGTSGTAPAFNTVVGTGVHTLNIPMASTASVTAGLISKTDYDNFNNKQAAGNYITALTGDVVAAGPGSSTATIQANAVTTSKIADGAVTTVKLADGNVTTVKIADANVTTVKVADKAITYAKIQDMATNRLLGRSTASSGSVEEIQLGGGLTLSGGVLNTVNGGTVTSISSTNAYLSVANPTTTPALTVNVGTAANTVAAGDDARIVGALQRSGGTMTGAINMGGNDLTNVGNIVMASDKNIQIGNYASDPSTAGWGASDKGKTWFNSTSNQLKYWDGSAVQVLPTGAGTVSSVSVTAPVQNTGTATAPVIGMPVATGSANGYLASADWTTFNNKLGAVSNTATLANGKIWIGDALNKAQEQAVSGDISLSNAGVVAVNKIKGTTVSAVPTVAGQVLRYDGTNYTPNFVAMTDLRSSVTGTNSFASSCASNQTLTYNSVGDIMSCTNISLPVAQITGTLPIANGGTGQTTATAAFNALAPSQGSNSGKYLTTDGTNTSWAALPGAISSLNGSTQATQTFANGTSGTAPAFNTVVGTGVHTLNIPMASTASVTAGLISKTDYDNFNNKQAAGNYITALTGDVVAAGPGSSTATIQANAVTTSKIADANVTTVKIADSNVTTVKIADQAVTFVKMQNIATQRLLGRSTAGTGSPEELQIGTGLTLSGGTLTATGTGGTVTSVTSANSYITITPTTTTPVVTANVGTAANTLAAGDDARIVGALQRSGGTMTGAINMGGNDLTNVGNIAMAANKNIQIGNYASDPSTGSWTAADKGKTWFNTTSNQLKYWDGSAVQIVGLNGAGMQSLNGSSVSSQSFPVPGTSGTAPGWSTNTGTGAHTLNIPMASTASVTAGLLSKTDYDAFAAKLGTGTSFSGDVSGAYNSTSVDKIKGIAVSATAPTSAGQVLRYNGTTQYAPGFLSLADIRSTVTPTATMFPTTSCTSAQTLTWSSLTDTMSCSAITVGASNFGSQAANTVLAAPNGSAGTPTFRALVAADLPNAMTTLGDIIYGGASGVQTRLAGNTTATKMFLTQTGTGSVSAAPAWAALSASDVSNSVINGGQNGAVTVGSNDANTLTLETNNAAAVTVLSGGNVGIGTTTPVQKLDVVGTIRAGSASSPQGSTILVDAYASGNLTVIGTNYSSGGPMIGYGVTPSTTTADAFLSSTPLAVTRSALAMSDSLRFFTGASQTVAVGSAVTLSEAMRITNSGNVGIGSSAPGSKLDVSGTMRGTSISAGSASIATAAIDFSTANSITTSYDCAGGNLSLANLRDGGSYVVVVTSTTAAQCSFNTSVTGTDAGTVTYRFNIPNGPRVTTSHSIYNLMRVGANVYVSWNTGFQ